MSRYIRIKNTIIGRGKPKICVPITNVTLEDIKKEFDEIIKEEVDIIEWRADFFNDLKNVGAVVDILTYMQEKSSKTIVLFTIRTKEEGGNIDISFEEYKRILEEVSQSKRADIIDVQLEKSNRDDIRNLVSTLHLNKSVVVGSYHNFQMTPKHLELVKKLNDMRKISMDILKIAVMPNHSGDVLTLLNVTNDMKVIKSCPPVITMSMGDLGKISRISGEIFGSCVTFASIKQASAPGQLELSNLKSILKTLKLKKRERISNIVLIGFMGTGKSAVSRALSEKINSKVVDVDEYIETTNHMTIADMFSQHGEEFFRDAETKAIKEISNEQNIIISCGGGAVIRKENVDALKKKGKIILLTAKPETVFDRVKYSKNRPILNNNMSVSFIEELMKKRKELYESVADITIATDEKDINQVCEEIIKHF